MGRDPFKDWVIISVVTCVVAITLIIVGVSSYHRVDSAISIVPEVRDNGRLPFDQNSLENAIKVLDLRVSKQSSIINANIPLAPS